MTNPEIESGCTEVYPTVSVADLRATVDYYHEQLGFKVQFEWGEPPIHAGVTLGAATLHFNQPSDLESINGRFWLYFVVEDVDDLYSIYQRRDVELLDEPIDREWGMREFNVRDINGISLRFAHASLRFGDPIQVERKSIDARIETRLAGLLEDLAKHKGMSVGEALEETLLHSFESAKIGESVASPHSVKTMSIIDELKKKHGIDYGTHDAYRFKEE